MSERLEEMLRIAQAATKGAWYEDSRGREHSEHDPLYYVVQAEMNKLPVTVADTLNCDSCLTADEQHANAQHIATFNPRTAEALVKVALAAIEPLHGEDYGYHRCKICGGDSVAQITGIYHENDCPISALTAAMEDSSNVG